MSFELLRKATSKPVFDSKYPRLHAGAPSPLKV